MTSEPLCSLCNFFIFLHYFVLYFNYINNFKFVNTLTLAIDIIVRYMDASTCESTVGQQEDLLYVLEAFVHTKGQSRNSEPLRGPGKVNARALHVARESFLLPDLFTCIHDKVLMNY